MSTQCRYCNFDLDDGDILEVLSKDPYYAQADLLKICSSYGWTVENKCRFSKVKIIQFDRKPQIEICPECNGISPLDINQPKVYYT
jgi:hypothetical protein